MDPPPSHGDNISILVVIGQDVTLAGQQLINTTCLEQIQTPDAASARIRISPERVDRRNENRVGELPDLPSPPYSSGIKPREKSKRFGRGLGMWSPTLSNMLNGNYLGGGRSGRSKLRTPRTLTRLMQQHRDSERHRHQGLNATIKDISRKIPGYEDATGETKIVKLQRVISYICHLEQRIMSLCEEQGLDLEYKNLFLLPHLPNGSDVRKTGPRSSPPGGRSVASVIGPRPSYRSSRVTSGRTIPYRSHCRRRVRLSSPSIDSIKGCMTLSAGAQPALTANTDVTNFVSVKHELPTLHDDVTGDYFGMETATNGGSQETMTLPSGDSLPSVLHVTVLKEPENCAVNWLDCAAAVDVADMFPDMYDMHQHELLTDMHKHCDEGIATSQASDVTNDVTTFHSYAKSPSAPATSIVKKENTELEWFPDTSGQHTSTTVVCSGATSCPATTLRPPLHSLSNLTDNGSGQASVLHVEQLLLPPGGKPNMPSDWTSSLGAATDNSVVREQVENVEPPSGSLVRSGRIDHRKTSWMNGFMMYSRMHRKLYIEENPGVHTSHISKLMGHDWRQLNPARQQPYREKAKLYIKQHLSPHVYNS